uniref:mRNA export factor ICP27 homolog n=1 Tax=Human betaherpesvirus 6 TaxID=10368 RepID=A0A1W6J2J4_9BETA|nr:mRNA export factor ICP27 [Human betaherpesvirus 6]
MYPRGVKRSQHDRHKQTAFRTIKRSITHRPTSKFISHFAKNFRGKLAPLKQLDESRLDALSLTELEQLKTIIEEKQQEKRAQNNAITFLPNLPTVPFADTNFSIKSLGLRPYNGDARDPKQRIRDRFPQTHERICLLTNDILETDLLLRYRQCLDSLTREENQQLMGDRIFSLTNSPCLAFTVATVEEACSYFKFHDLHNLPVNPQDLFMYTITVMKFEFFNKLNMAKLTCVFNDNGHGDIEYRKLRQLCGKPVLDREMPNSEFEVQQQTPDSFRHPIQQAMSIVVTFARILRQIKEHIILTKKPQFIRDFDTERVAERYECGLISRLIGKQFSNHKCDDVSCQNRIERIMAPWKPSLFFCTYFAKDAPKFKLFPNLPHEYRNLSFTCPKVDMEPSCSYSTSRDLPQTSHRSHKNQGTPKVKSKVCVEKPDTSNLTTTKTTTEILIEESMETDNKIPDPRELNFNQAKQDEIVIININENVNSKHESESSVEMDLDLDYEADTCETNLNTYSSDSE